MQPDPEITIIRGVDAAPAKITCREGDLVNVYTPYDRRVSVLCEDLPAALADGYRLPNRNDIEREMKEAMEQGVREARDDSWSTAQWMAAVVIAALVVTVLLAAFVYRRR